MFILGILGQPANFNKPGILDIWKSGWYHNSSAVLLKDGFVIAGIEEERLTRFKNHGRFPFLSIAFCLKYANIQLTDVGHIAFGEEGGIGEFRDSSITAANIANILQAYFKTNTSLVSRITLVEHHICHAMSAYGPSGFQDALIMTADGFGDGISGLVAEGSNGRLTNRLADLPVSCSLGHFYSSVLAFLGYRQGEEYKVMGLSSYGDAGRLQFLFDKLYTLEANGLFSLETTDPVKIVKILSAYGYPRPEGGDFSQYHMDVASGIQSAFERIFFHVLAWYKQLTGHANLCLAGGATQNSLFNGKLLSFGLFQNIYVQPAAHDAGVALGAALQVHNLETTGTYTGPCHNYWGTDLPPSAVIASKLLLWNGFIEYAESANVYTDTSQLLAENKIVGWIQGRSEFGPRALGNRSILADPRPAENKDKINAIIKGRESFRPFASAVGVEDVDEYFEVPPSQKFLPFMTFVTVVRDEKREQLGAVTHVDGTARIQTVSRDFNRTFWKLLNNFKEKTGLPVLINTSFNNSKEPIVDSIDDAIVCFLTTDLDFLVIKDWIIKKKHKFDFTDLRVKIKAGVIVSKYLAGCLPEENIYRYVLVEKGIKETEISKMCYILLAFDGACAVKEVTIASANEHSGHSSLSKELFSLWSKRLINITPIDNDNI
jgi:carbamoyltransferase